MNKIHSNTEWELFFPSSENTQVCVRLLTLVRQCCGELMFRQRPAGQTNFHAITGTVALFFPLFSHSLSLGCQGGRVRRRVRGGRCKCDWECVILYELLRGRMPSRCLLWSAGRPVGFWNGFGGSWLTGTRWRTLFSQIWILGLISKQSGVTAKSYSNAKID